MILCASDLSHISLVKNRVVVEDWGTLSIHQPSDPPPLCHLLVLTAAHCFEFITVNRVLCSHLSLCGSCLQSQERSKSFTELQSAREEWNNVGGVKFMHILTTLWWGMKWVVFSQGHSMVMHWWQPRLGYILSMLKWQCKRKCLWPWLML